MFPKIFRTLLPSLFLGTICSHAVAASHPYLQILSEDDSGLTLALTLPPFEVDTIATAAQSCHRLLLPEWGKTLEPGYPELPVTSALIQVPQYGDITAQVLDVQADVLPGVELCPVPKRRVSEAGEIISDLIWNREAYQKWDFFPESPLAVGSREILRGVPVSRLRIFPFQWHSATQELRYFNQIRLRVQFENRLPRRAFQAEADLTNRAGAYEGLLQSTILNYSGQPAGTNLESPPSSSQQGSQTEFSQRQGVREVSTRHVKQHDALRIDITTEGVYKLSYEDFVEAGLQPQLMNPARLRLFNRGEEVAIRVYSEESDQFKPGDTIEFYAPGFETVFTDTNVYWLYWRKKGFGKRMTQVDGEVTGEGEPIQAFSERLLIEKNNQYWLETPDAPEQDYRFWQRLNASDVKEYTFQVPAPFSEPTEAIVRVGFQGRSTAPPHPNHHTVIKLNGTVIGDDFWDGDSPYIQEMRISSALFVADNNTLTVEMPGDTGAVVDVIYLDWIAVEYWRAFEAVNNTLVFTVTGNGKMQVAVNKLTQPDLMIYDITNPFDVAEVINFAVDGETRNYQAIFETLALGDKRFYVSNRQQTPASITPVQPANLKARKNGADYLLITDQDFVPAVQPLGELRRRQGLRVKIVSVQDIYNEFNDGVFDPAAIKAFLQYAYQNWDSPAPTYVFLVGDASLKYLNSTAKKTNKVPTHLSASWDGLIPDDSWYVSVDGDDILPDMFIGRIPGNSPETVADLIDKIIRFEESTLANPHKVLLVADSNSDFEDLNEGLIDYLPGEFGTDKVYLRSYLADVDKDERDEKIAQATEDIMSSFNDGVMISNYIGHGVVDRWSSSKGLFKPENVHALNNNKQLAFTLMLTCINGYFVDAGKYSFAEEFLLAPGGAIAAFAPSNVSYTWEDMILANAVFSTIFKQGNRNLGAITTQAKIAAYEQGASQNLLKMFTLFGDPALSLKDWR